MITFYRHIAILLAGAILLCGCSSRTAERELTLMTYNVGVFSKYMDNSTEGVAAIIRGQGAALVALNELDSCNTRHQASQARDLADALGDGWSCHYARAMAYKGGAYGNGVVSASPILARYRVALDKGVGAEPRSVAVAETEDCVFAAVHLDHRSQEAALAQMGQINDWFGKVFKDCPKPVFLCGDFNVVPESEVIALARTRWTLLSGVDFTHSTRNPKHCIDYIFAFKDAAPVEVLQHHVITEGTGDLSDHFPVMVRVKFNKSLAK